MAGMSSPDIDSARQFLAANARVRHPWLDRATELLWTRIGELTTPGPYDMRAVLRFLDHVPDRDRAQHAISRVGSMTVEALHLLRANGRCSG
jgi:hypothetical protein